MRFMYLYLRRLRRRRYLSGKNCCRQKHCCRKFYCCRRKYTSAVVNGKYMVLAFSVVVNGELAPAEASERAAAEAREKAAKEKAAVAKAEADARRRAERIAVERVNAQARERAAAEARDRAAAAKMNQQKNDNDLESFFSSRASSAPRPRDPAPDPLSQNRQGQQGPQRTSSTGVSSNMKKASSTTNIVDDLNSIGGASFNNRGLKFLNSMGTASASVRKYTPG